MGNRHTNMRKLRMIGFHPRFNSLASLSLESCRESQREPKLAASLKLGQVTLAPWALMVGSDKTRELVLWF